MGARGRLVGRDYFPAEHRGRAYGFLLTGELLGHRPLVM